MLNNNKYAIFIGLVNGILCALLLNAFNQIYPVEIALVIVVSSIIFQFLGGLLCSLLSKNYIKLIFFPMFGGITSVFSIFSFRYLAFSEHNVWEMLQNNSRGHKAAFAISYLLVLMLYATPSITKNTYNWAKYKSKEPVVQKIFRD
jgi:hypothetical protein